LWLGNDQLHQLTASGRYKLRVDLQATNGSWYYAEYSSFVVSSEASNYLMQVSGYSGNAGDEGFLYSDGTMFSTYDRDHDRSTNNNCAAVYAGGFWYNACSYALVNSGSFRWYNGNARWIHLRTSRMWLTC